MESLKIALRQIAPCGTLEGNLEKGINSCRKAKELGADIALFPKMWSNGGSSVFDGVAYLPEPCGQHGPRTPLM